MPTYPMVCDKCGLKREFFVSVARYEELKGSNCEKCGEAGLERDWSKQEPPKMIMDFRPHYCYATGRFEQTKNGMFEHAKKIGVNLQRVW